MATTKFKPCMQHQIMLLPPDISELIPEQSMVRVIDSIVDDMDTSKLRALYPGGGAPAYDPVMMLKIVLFAYASGIYSSRKIAKATAENINFMWLCGMQPLDHNTINRFRTQRIRPVFEDIFLEIVMVLEKAGYITLDTYFLDGTKIEANANKYSFVWKKSTDRYQTALRAKVQTHLSEIDKLNDEEEALAPKEPEQVNAETIREAATKINERLKKKEEEQTEKDDEGKALKKAARAIEKDYLPRMQDYENKQEIFNGRNSFSKTDTDATFMRMKDDPMRNGQTKAAYNIQVGTENQFIIDATLHQKPNDTACAIAHCEHLKNCLGHLPHNFVADAGYGSEETYTYLEEEGVEAYVKHNEFFRETKKKWREDEMRLANWDYDEKADTYTCPNGKTLSFSKERKVKSDRGFESTVRFYECLDCSNCPKRKKCFKSKFENTCKRIRVNKRLDEYKKKASALLHTEKGSKLRKQRGIDVETIFGDIKRNYGFTRFLLRGLEKVTHEFRLVAAGHNIRKLFNAKLNEGIRAKAMG